MQQVAALEDLIAAHPSWAGRVSLVTVNRFAAEGGLSLCAAGSVHPVVQEEDGDLLQAALGAGSNDMLIIGPDGVIRHNTVEHTFPAAGDEIAAVVESYLTP